jgi:hypothetical protein
MDSLPVEIIYKICEDLSTKEIMNLIMTNKDLYSIYNIIIKTPTKLTEIIETETNRFNFTNVVINTEFTKYKKYRTRHAKIISINENNKDIDKWLSSFENIICSSLMSVSRAIKHKNVMFEQLYVKSTLVGDFIDYDRFDKVKKIVLDELEVDDDLFKLGIKNIVLLNCNIVIEEKNNIENLTLYNCNRINIDNFEKLVYLDTDVGYNVENLKTLSLYTNDVITLPLSLKELKIDYHDDINLSLLTNLETLFIETDRNLIFPPNLMKLGISSSENFDIDISYLTKLKTLISPYAYKSDYVEYFHAGFSYIMFNGKKFTLDRELGLENINKMTNLKVLKIDELNKQVAIWIKNIKLDELIFSMSKDFVLTANIKKITCQFIDN